MAADNAILGVGWGFPPTFERGSNDVQMVSDEEDIRQSIGILLSTMRGERVMRPRYGCDLKRELFENLDRSWRAYLQDEIRIALLYHEPRVRPDAIEVVPHPLEGRVDIMVSYTVRTTNTRYNMVHPFYLEEST